MEKGVSFHSFKNYFKVLWKFLAIGIILCSLVGGILFKVSDKKYNYTAVSSLFIDRKYVVDQNGNGFFDEDSGKFWGNFMSFTEYPWEIKKIQKEFPAFDKNRLTVKYPNYSNILEISYTDSDAKTALGITSKLTNLVLENTKQYLTGKADVKVIHQADQQNLIKKSTSSLQGNIMIGFIYGTLIGFIIGSIYYLIKRKKRQI